MLTLSINWGLLPGKCQPLAPQGAGMHQLGVHGQSKRAVRGALWAVALLCLPFLKGNDASGVDC